MHVGLNLVFLVPGQTGGMETYARRLTEALVRERPDVRFTAFVNRETASSADWGGLLPTVVVPVHARHRAEWVVGEQTLLPRRAARERIDVLHSLGNTAPAWGPFRRVVTVHDLIYHLYPASHPGLNSLGLRVLVPLAARRSHRIAVPSQSTRDELVRLLHVQPSKIDVVYPGHEASDSVEPVDERTLRERYELAERPVVLEASGYKHRHKNIARLLEALALLPAGRRPVLVLTGASTVHEEELRAGARALGLESDTRFTGWIPDEELEGLYRIASCLVLPSLYEGFGLPVVEAMARGLPVACSDRGAVAEAAGEAALLFEPERPAEIAGAIETLLGNEQEARRLRALGLERARTFTWAAAAQATLESYERALSEAGGSELRA